MKNRVEPRPFTKIQDGCYDFDHAEEGEVRRLLLELCPPTYYTLADSEILKYLRKLSREKQEAQELQIAKRREELRKAIAQREDA